jgi:hypothetical protein
MCLRRIPFYIWLRFGGGSIFSKKVNSLYPTPHIWPNTHRVADISATIASEVPAPKSSYKWPVYSRRKTILSILPSSVFYSHSLESAGWAKLQMSSAIDYHVTSTTSLLLLYQNTKNTAPKIQLSMHSYTPPVNKSH